MTGKQIMIDGVDVSKCIFFDKNYKEDDVQIKNFCELQYISCKEFDCANCYFKKWKRKEQECDQLKVELEQEKALKETYLTCYKAKHGDIDGELFKLKQTLTEIKEIALGVRNYLACPSPRDVRYEMDIILQKISECEVKNERNRKDV